MKIYKEIQAIERKVIGVICDRCKIRFDDISEIQEFHHVDFVGGYNSVFGDGSVVEIDICQHCLKFIIQSFYSEKQDNYNNLENRILKSIINNSLNLISNPIIYFTTPDYPYCQNIYLLDLIKLAFQAGIEFEKNDKKE